MANIEKVTTGGALARNKKMNEVIGKTNSLLNMKFETIDSDAEPQVEYSDNNVALRIPRNGATIDFNEMTVVICVNGSPVNKIILAKDP